MKEQPKNIQSEPGRFWTARDGADLDPSASMEGLLTIKDDGQAELELFPQTWAWDIPLDDATSLRHIDIVGQLHRIGQSIRLTEAWWQKFGPLTLKAFTCLVAPGDAADFKFDRCIETLTIPLGATWPWLGRPMPTWAQKDDHYEVEYPSVDDRHFKLSKGTMTVSSWYAFSFDVPTRSSNVTPVGEVRFQFQDAITLAEAQTIYLNFEDLLVLLSNQECGLGWPEVSISGTDNTGFLFGAKRRKSGGAISYLECWLPYPDIEHVFGTIVDDWLCKRAEYGAAFHLYLGTRRGGQLYAEHRFVNLMWGLEALHRKHWPVPPENRERKTRVENIIVALDGVANSDEKRKIRRALLQEPTLEDRLQRMFLSLPVGMPKEAIKQFAATCAGCRNEISHYGGPGDQSSYKKFPLHLHELSNALDPLYHALILSAISVPRDAIQDIFRKPHKSFRDQHYLKQVGLEISGCS